MNIKKLHMNEIRSRQSGSDDLNGVKKNVNDFLNQLKVTLTNILADLALPRRMAKRCIKPSNRSTQHTPDQAPVPPRPIVSRTDQHAVVPAKSFRDGFKYLPPTSLN